jgi:hypothetical protein
MLVRASDFAREKESKWEFASLFFKSIWAKSFRSIIFALTPKLSSFHQTFFFVLERIKDKFSHA